MKEYIVLAVNEMSVKQFDELGAPELVRCKDCKYAHLTYDGYCKYCDNITDDDGFPIERYHPGDWFCADGERKE